MSGAAEEGDGDPVLAAEYVLGLLDTARRHEVEARLDVDPGLRAEVAFWADRLTQLADGLPEETPPARVRAALMAELFGREDATGGFRRRLGLWPIFVGAAVAAALAFVVFTSGLLDPGMEPEYRAELGSETSPVQFQANYDADTGSLHLVHLSGDPAPGRSLEFWVIAGDEPPVSVMVWPDGSTEERVTLPAPIAATLPGATLAISDEPSGGSPTGAPTGAVLVTGEIREL